MMSFLAPFVLFSLLLATRVDTCSVVIFFFLIYLFVNHKRFLRTRYAFSTGYEAAALFSDTEWCSYYFRIQKWCLASPPLKPSSTKIISTDHISHRIFV